MAEVGAYDVELRSFVRRFIAPLDASVIDECIRQARENRATYSKWSGADPAEYSRAEVFCETIHLALAARSEGAGSRA